MYALIDTTNLRALARHVEYMALAALAYIQFANVGTTIVPLDTRRELAQFSREEMAAIATGLGYVATPPPVEGEAYSYLLKTVHHLLSTVPWLEVPVPKEVLLFQAGCIDRNSDNPRSFVLPTSYGGNPSAGENPEPGYPQRWAVNPQRNVRRCDSSYGTFFSNNPQQPLNNPSVTSRAPATLRKRVPALPPTEDITMAAKKTPAAKAPAKKPTSKKTDAAPAKKTPAAKPAAKPPKPPKAPAEGKEARITQNGITRPKSGGNTGNVWEACDAVHTKKGSAPTFAEVDEHIEKKWPNIPTATRRSNYAVWRKFNGITGRVA